VLTTTNGKLPDGLISATRDPVFQPLFASAHSARRRKQHARHPKQQQQQQEMGLQQQQQQQQQQTEGEEGEEHDDNTIQQPSLESQLQPRRPVCLVEGSVPEQCACGWVFHTGDVFEGTGLLHLLKAISALIPRTVLRLKGVFR